MAGKSLMEQLKPVRRRLTWFRLRRMVLSGLLAGSMAGVLVLGAARLWPLLHAVILCLSFVLTGLLAGVWFGLWRSVSEKEAAREMDKSDTEDAIVTALDGLDAYEVEEEPVIVRLQREEATLAAGRYVSELKERLPWPSWRTARPVLFGLAVVWAGIVLLLLIPNPLQELAEAQAEIKSSVAELEQVVQGLEDELEKLELPQGAKEEILKPLDELRKELSSGGMKPAEALEKLAEAMRELERAADTAKEAVQRLDAIAEAMSGQPQLRPLGAALQDHDSAAVSQAIDDVRSSLKQLTDAEREQLAQALEKLAEQWSQELGNRADTLVSAFEEAAKQVRDNGEADSESGDALSGLEEELGRELTQGELDQLAREMVEQLGRSGEAIADSMRSQGAGPSIPSSWGGAASSAGSGSQGSAGGQPGSSGSGGQGNGSNPGSEEGTGSSGSGQGTGSGSASGSGQGTGSGPASGSGQGAGSGSGSGSGQGAGSGPGSGSGHGAGSGSESGTGQGTGGGAGSGNGAGLGAGSRTLVTTPRTMAGPGDVYVDGGPSTGGQIEQGGQSPMIDGLTRPYEEVYSEYAAEAKQSLGRSSLPASMQDKVKQYFDEIQPNR
ncbi:hypothetical protein [Paenibacillus sp. NPDC057967]|uniref:hypothetical protein n=1 Tax=Paenibacillus sp. NPDC057967 TaxID=3346293 RepID=UPI0036DA2276